MYYILLTILGAVFYAFYDFFKKIALRKSSLYEVLFFYTFIASIISLVFFKEIINTPLIGIGLIFLKSILISISWYLKLKAISKLNVSVAAPFYLLSTVFVVILAFFFFNEPISWQIITGINLVLIGLVLLSRLNKKEENKENDNRYIWLLVASGFISSCRCMIDKFALSNNHVSNGAMLFYFMFFLSIIYGVLYFIKNKKIEFKKLKTNYFWLSFNLKAKNEKKYQ